MPAPGEIAAIILAGGQGVRLGGGDKPLRTIAGRPMLDHVLERLKGQAGEIAISANGDPQRLAGYGLPVIPDEAAGAGPLAGILSGMRWAKVARRWTAADCCRRHARSCLSISPGVSAKWATAASPSRHRADAGIRSSPSGLSRWRPISPASCPAAGP